jgi:hypothetical protein
MVLVGLNPDTVLSWTLEEIAATSGQAGKRQTFALSRRLVEALEDLAARWRIFRVACF